MKIKHKHIVRFFGLYIFIVFFLHVMKTDGVESLGEYYLGIRGDHWAHGTMFFPMGILTLLSFQSRKKFAFGFIFFACFFFETLQYFLPYRSFDISDIVADSTGVIVGLLVYFLQGDFIQKRIQF